MAFLENRDISAIKGLAIIGVIAIHLVDYVLRPEIFVNLSLLTKVVSIIIYELSIMGVPIFIFLSGLLFNSKHLESLDNYLINRVLRLIVPFIIWTIIYLKVYYGTFENLGLGQLHYYFLFGWSHLYFIILMLQFAFIAPLAYKLVQRKLVLYLVIAFNLLLIFDFYYNTTLNGRTTFEIQHLFSFSIFWLGYYCLGLFIAARTLRYRIILPVLGFLIFFAIVLAEAVYLYGNQKMLSVNSLSYYRPSVFLMSLCFIFAMPRLLKLFPSYLKLILEGIGKLSFGIFLCHLLVMKISIPMFGISLQSVKGLSEGILIVLFLSAGLTYIVIRIPILNMLLGEIRVNFSVGKSEPSRIG